MSNIVDTLAEALWEASGDDPKANVRAALRTVKPSDISDEMVEAANAVFMNAEDPESGDILRRALAAAIAAGA